MKEKNHYIPYYHEINDFMKAIPSEYRTDNPDFFCLRMKKDEGPVHNYMPPFRKGFYFIGLVTTAGNSSITFDNSHVSRLDSFLVFQHPGLVYSFYRDSSSTGYLIYFKQNCLSFFRPDLDREFPFFDILQTNFFKMDNSRFMELSPCFEDVFTAYENPGENNYTIASVKLLTLLYQLKEYTTVFNRKEEKEFSQEQIILQKYVQLVNSYYIEKRKVEQYAELINITPNYLSQLVKSVTGNNALSYINNRIIAEAKLLVKFTGFTIAEITYRLNFSDTANFGKFFKKHTGLTPLEYRKQTD